jgi:hypothetical protein
VVVPRMDCGRLLPRIAPRGVSFAAVLMSLIFAHVIPIFAADNVDSRLMLDVVMAKETIAILKSRDFTAIRERSYPAIASLSDDVLSRFADTIAGEAKSVETVSSKGTFDPASGNSESQTVLEYQIGSHWVVADVVVKTENSTKRISGLYFSVNSQPLRELGTFRISGKGYAQYAFLAGWIGVIGLTGCAILLAFRRHSGWRRWALVIAMPIGFGPTVAMNWNNGAFWIWGGSVTNSAVSFYPILGATFPMAWFGMLGGTEFGVPVLSTSVPLIAIGYLIWTSIDAIAASRSRSRRIGPLA